MKSSIWLLDNLTYHGLFPFPHFVRLVRVFPLQSLHWFYGKLVSRLQTAYKNESSRWHGLRLIAADKTTLSLPESKSLWKRFRSHSGQQGLGPISAELCCLFDIISRAPIHFVYDKVCTSEHKLINKLIKYIKKGDLILLDSGFHYSVTFNKIMLRCAHFLIPAKKNIRPKVLRNLGEGDYLCQIKDYNSNTDINVRVVFVYRKGFRRRRLITSLLDPVRFPAAELANLYHMRWDIETFYRDFKHTFRATSWHCRTPDSFHLELLMHMISICLIRIAMVHAGKLVNLYVGHLSFARALTETRLFFKILVSTPDLLLWCSIWKGFIHRCSKHRVRIKPGRHFSRNQQEYRRKSRGLEIKSRGRKIKYAEEPLITRDREILKDRNGNLFLLS